MRWQPLGILAAVIVLPGLGVVCWLIRRRVVRRRRAASDRRQTQRSAGRRQARRPATAELDPFEVLWLQVRLGALATEVRELERSGEVYGRMHHLTATQAAYDALLIEACLLAGIAIAPALDARRTVPQGDVERFREELELTSLGWSW